MAKFSDRIGATVPPPLQLNSLSDELRMGLWNDFCTHVFRSHGLTGDEWMRPARMLYREIGFPVDEVHSFGSARARIKEWFFQQTLPWYSVFNLMEFCVQNSAHVCTDPRERAAILPVAINRTLEEHNSGYRVIGDTLAPITNAEEMDAVQEAASMRAAGSDGARIHIQAAIQALSAKPSPDYRNCIKESISAVESVVKVIIGQRGGDLKAALEKFHRAAPLHGALKDGLVKLYGYTSDEGGIRHGLIDEPTVGFDDAKFMLVACSAFVNYLVAKANAEGLLP